ncbi:DUF2203 domain-containing protein [Alkalihalobacillus sp. R86527]|uniref:DUF2203 domain-containing protein n=1 Tax=Alkalihalobacillus sp. R86527 TaxID=3093863 RepID=UPI00366C5E58
MEKRYFTEQEANELIPEIKRELGSLKRVTQAFSEHYEQLEQHKKTLLFRNKTKVDEDLLFKKESRMEFMELEAQTFIRNILSIGVKIVDIESGVVSFPSFVNGVEVELYWHETQEAVSFSREALQAHELTKEDDQV